MKDYNNNLKYKKSLNRKVSSDSISSSLMKTTISIFKNKIDYSLLNQNEKNLNSTKKSGKSFFLSEKKNSTQLPKKRYDIKKYNIIKESNKSYFLKSFYNPNPKYKLYLNNSSHSTIIQPSLYSRKSDNMALFQKQLNSRKSKILNNSLPQNLPYSFRRQTIEEHKIPIRNLFLFSTKNKDVNNKRNKIFNKQDIKIENYQFKRKNNSFNEENQKNNIGKYTDKKINIFNKRSSDSNLLNKIIDNKTLFRIKRNNLNNDKNEKRIRNNSMNDITREIKNNMDLDFINKNEINTSIFKKNNINEIKTTLNKNSIKIISKINKNNDIKSSTHKNSFNSLETIYNNEIKSDKNIKNNINNNDNINIELKRNSIYSIIQSIKKNENMPESRRNSIYSSIHSIKKNEIIPDLKRKSKEMIDNNDKNEMNNIIINRKSIVSLKNNNKNENIPPFSNINNINNEKDNKIEFKKNENNEIIDNDKDEENNKKNINKIISFINENNDNNKKNEKRIPKKKVCFSTKKLLQYENKNKENNRVASLKNKNFNKSTTNIFSFESESDLSKEDIKKDRNSFKKKSRKETINLTKKLLVENTKEKLKIISRYIKKNKSSLLIQNKFHNLKNRNNKFLNKIYNDIDQSVINKNNNHIVNEKVKLLRFNFDNFNSLLNELKNEMKEIYDINITDELNEIYEKNNDSNSFNFYFDLIIPCNINYNLSKYIFRNIEFKGVLRNQFNEEKQGNKYEIIKKNSRKSMISFPSIRKNKLFISKLERFLIDKTNLIKKDEDSRWKKEKCNFMMVHKFKIKSLSWAKNENALINKTCSKKFEVFQRNDYKSKLRNTLHVSKRKIIGIQRISITSSINTKNINRSMLKKKTISLFKRPSLDLRSSIKKKRRKNFNKISILINKTFFNRKNETNINYPKKSSIFLFEDNQNKDNLINNENIDINILEHPKSIDDIYFGLTLLIAKGKEYQFRKYFNKYEKIIDIDFPIYEGNTLLMMSTKEGMAGITRFLCEKKADVNLKNDRGNTALHYAIGQKFYKIGDILTIFGAREDILNNKGLSPWEC